MKQRKRLYSSLVTAKPAKETAGDAVAAVTQEISAFTPSVVVPQDDSDTSDRINTLRLFDLAMTPGDMAGSYGLPAWALDTARLSRAVTHAKRAGMLPDIRSPDESNFRKAAEAAWRLPPTPCQAAMDRAAVCFGFPPSDRFRPVETWEETIDLARELFEEAQRHNEPQPQPQPQPQGNPGGGGGGEDGEDIGDGPEIMGNGEPQPGDKPGKVPSTFRLPDRLPPKPVPRVPTTVSGRKIPEEKLEGSDPWAMGTTPPPSTGLRQTGHCSNFHKPDLLPMERRKRKKGSRRRSDDVGDLAMPERLGVDNLLFKDGVVRGGYRGRGSVMVDMSGSMSWTEQDFATLLDVLPEAAIYGYCGRHGYGRIVLLADRGKTAKLDAITQWKRTQGGGNEIDDSALRFLCRQAKPRVWVSDGGVCADGCDTSHMNAECDKAIAAGRIVRVLTGVEAAKVLLGR